MTASAGPVRLETELRCELRHWHRRKLSENSKASHPTATAPVVDSTPHPLLMRAGQSQAPERAGVGPQFVGDQQLWSEALLLE